MPPASEEDRQRRRSAGRRRAPAYRCRRRRWSRPSAGRRRAVRRGLGAGWAIGLGTPVAEVAGSDRRSLGRRIGVDATPPRWRRRTDDSAPIGPGRRAGTGGDRSAATGSGRQRGHDPLDDRPQRRHHGRRRPADDRLHDRRHDGLGGGQDGVDEAVDGGADGRSARVPRPPRRGCRRGGPDRGRGPARPRRRRPGNHRRTRNNAPRSSSTARRTGDSTRRASSCAWSRRSSDIARDIGVRIGRLERSVAVDRSPPAP